MSSRPCDAVDVVASQAAERLGVAQPRISEIARYKVDKLSLDYLVGLCAKAGVAVKVRTAASHVVIRSSS